ncbi:MAG: hypothetical protein R3Y63_15040, partial [Eubacteriales bacterium]
RAYSDNLCREFGLSVCQPKEQKTEPVSGKEYHSAVRGESWKMKLVSTIDLCMAKAKSKKHFKKLMFDQGYDVKWEENRKYLTYFTPEGQRCRCNKLHDKKYSKELMEREFRIREEIIARGIEEVESSGATAKVRSTPKQHTTNSTTVDTDGRGLGDDFGEPENPVGQDGTDGEPKQQKPTDHDDSSRAGFRQEETGRTDTTGGEDSADTRTGWEKEREKLFSSKNVSPPTRNSTRFSGTDDGAWCSAVG